MSAPLHPAPTEAELVEEILAAPRGPHSPEAAAFFSCVVNHPAARRVVGVTLRPFHTWALARLPQDPDARIVLERETLFHSEDAIERALFRRRLALARVDSDVSP